MSICSTAPPNSSVHTVTGTSARLPYTLTATVPVPAGRMVGNISGHKACGSQPSASAVARAFTAWGSDSPLTQRPTVLTSTPAPAASLLSLKPLSLIRAASARLGTGSLSTSPSYDAGDHAPVVNLGWPRR